LPTVGIVVGETALFLMPSQNVLQPFVHGAYRG
jgi:hypothetical protein